ncbi:hypothetical protein BBO99_00006305 [Phytophthora kernoviae]|uniref:Uncharacterized protein n=2 Tax=Phytophthora kernoviae TaxID=325452 RepID=A0A421F7L3_9STRA|nr:hypothetical protein G195_009712 [Phytophthora kernoviae 00238/432]KAG2511675.1 hypothetical protein JM16_006165 [Phytophthora kernoviae]KAG2515783.1 hypothetical protein JM18_008122 [Phytophthora kernoviae]RLN27033.1 hypothetical protein BBI17_006442 [Phytophthora kernoviae]RLN77999.1 hypothetical protein BBO99_00006305 [Phytophthora kernoviae]
MTSPHEAATAAPTRAEKPRRLHIPAAAAENSRVRAATASKDALAPSHEAAKASIETDMRSQTCVEFLHIMKEFSESSCDANEMVQRVDSLVSQDEQLLRLFPLSRQQGEDEAARRLRRALEDEDDASVERITARDNDKEMENQDELQRWMDLDLGDLDHHHMDVFDFQHSQPLGLNEVMDAAAATQVNRTVSHILSSCLHKRKLHHPYKNQVQLVNFSVPGGGPDSDGASGHGTGQHSHQLGGSLATSLAFGGQQNGTLNGTDGLNGFVPLLATGHENSLGGSSKSPGKSEKRTPKKREERKRLMTLKMQETFADLEGTFTEQDLDVKGIVGPGASLSKMALSKLENLPLPDLTNLPADLRELKRKIEATEHKVEGTKHRHRKGGPCPRCQVQNQLRAAKRAYHKRAVAHKKLPHVVVNAVNDEAQEAANAQAAAAATLELAENPQLLEPQPKSQLVAN